MKMNIKVRLKNPTFWSGIVVSVMLTITAYLGLSIDEITSWQAFFNMLLSAVKNPVVVVAVISNIYNALVDPTTSGISDSKEALSYKKPKKE